MIYSWLLDFPESNMSRNLKLTIPAHFDWCVGPRHCSNGRSSATGMTDQGCTSQQCRPNFQNLHVEFPYIFKVISQIFILKYFIFSKIQKTKMTSKSFGKIPKSHQKFWKNSQCYLIKYFKVRPSKPMNIMIKHLRKFQKLIRDF